MDLVSLTLAKMRREKARGVLVVPNWLGAPWMEGVKEMGVRIRVHRAAGLRDIWAGRRRRNSSWSLLDAEVGLRSWGGGRGGRKRKRTRKRKGKGEGLGGEWGRDFRREGEGGKMAEEGEGKRERPCNAPKEKRRRGRLGQARA